MNFTRALQTETAEERDELIFAEADEHSWADYLDEYLRFGGWPDNAYAEAKDIHDETDEQIIAKIDVAFVESVPSSCSDINHEHQGYATFLVTIDKATGRYEVEVEDAVVHEFE